MSFASPCRRNLVNKNTDIKQLRNEMVNFFVAGYETASMSLSVSCKISIKKCKKKARDEVISVFCNDTNTIPSSDQLKVFVSAIVKEILMNPSIGTIITFRNLKKPIKIGRNRQGSKDLHKWQIENNPKETFILHDGPPYAIGSLHIEAQ
ncbi:hypothetical protein RhiirB3_439353 [Rhizophagus irregularis]|nr:hypothetical protein RhiirB3_439353 [Rhizophagus irregularis]